MIVIYTEEEALAKGFKWRVEKGFCVITGYSGKDLDLVIPGFIGNNMVVIIQEEVFAGKGITKLSMPKSLGYIGAGAFKNNLLTEIELPPCIHELSYEVFANNLIEQITLPASIGIVEDHAFSFNPIAEIVMTNAVYKFGKIDFKVIPKTLVVRHAEKIYYSIITLMLTALKGLSQEDSKIEFVVDRKLEAISVLKSLMTGYTLHPAEHGGAEFIPYNSNHLDAVDDEEIVVLYCLLEELEEEYYESYIYEYFDGVMYLNEEEPVETEELLSEAISFINLLLVIEEYSKYPNYNVTVEFPKKSDKVYKPNSLFDRFAEAGMLN